MYITPLFIVLDNLLDCIVWL